MRRFFCASKTHVKTDGSENNRNFTLFCLLNWPNGGVCSFLIKSKSNLVFQNTIVFIQQNAIIIPTQYSFTMQNIVDGYLNIFLYKYNVIKSPKKHLINIKCVRTELLTSK